MASTPAPMIDAWRHRRKWVYRSLYFAGAVILLALAGASLGRLSDGVAITAITSAFTHGGAVLAFYIYGANQDDKNRMERQP